MRCLVVRSAAVILLSRWRGKQAMANVWAVITLQKSLRDLLAKRKKAALLCLQMAVERMALAKSCRKEAAGELSTVPIIYNYY